MAFPNRQDLKEIGKLIDRSNGRYRSCPQHPSMSTEANSEPSTHEVRHEALHTKPRIFKTLEALKKTQNQNKMLFSFTIGKSTFLDTNGWRPVSTETVYNQIRRKNAQEPTNAATHNFQVMNTGVNKDMSTQYELLKQEKREDEIQSTFEVFNAMEKCTTKDITNCQVKKTYPLAKPDNNFVPNVFYTLLQYNDTSDKSSRRSKKITNFNSKAYVQELLLNETGDKTVIKGNTYEVTEESDLEDKSEQESSETNESGYKYEPPKKENSTSQLFKILSKYNIRKDDELLNYALSRRKKTQNANAKPFRFKIPNSHNSLNHLTLDPLLAVFLSHYGCYLQGFYGVHNQYNNLYAYLASNNIHNNKPFGFYKLFSDTDSSH